MERKKVFIHSEDAQLALKLVRLLDGNGITVFCVSEDEAAKLEQLWQWGACIRQVQGDGSLVD
jgi:hypothetical protein